VSAWCHFLANEMSVACKGNVCRAAAERLFGVSQLLSGQLSDFGACNDSDCTVIPMPGRKQGVGKNLT